MKEPNVTKIQHFVPCVILQEWSDTKTRRGKIKAYKKKTKEFIFPHVDNVCWEKSLYETKTLPLNLVEKYYGKVEENIGRILKQRYISKTDEMFLSGYLFVQMLRTPEAVEAVNFLASETNKELPTDFSDDVAQGWFRATMSGAYHNLSDANNEKITNEFQKQGDEVQKEWITRMASLVGDDVFLGLIHSSKECYFLQNDLGVVLTCYKGKPFWIMPLTPTLAVICVSSANKRLIVGATDVINKQALKQANSSIEYMANELVFYPYSSSNLSK